MPRLSSPSTLIAAVVLGMTIPLAADPITFRFEGTAEVTLAGAPHPGSHYVITLRADTANVVVHSWFIDLDGPSEFEITGVGSGQFITPTRIFVNHGGLVAGFSKSKTVGGADLIDFNSPLFATYALNAPIGPIFDPSPSATGQFMDIETSAGLLSLEALDVTFTATMGGECYPDCDGDEALTLADFGCFQTKFGLGDPYADCDGDTVLTLADFGCFQTSFGLGCP
jgi:hypothetical protein